LLLAILVVVALAPGAARAQSALPDSAFSEPAPSEPEPEPESPDSTEGESADSTVAIPDVPDSADVAPVTPPLPPPPPPSATLSIETQPPGLQVQIDGAPVGRSPVGPLAVPPGSHRIRAIPADPRRYGVSSTETVVTLPEGTERTVRFDLRPPVVLRTDPEPALVTRTGQPAAADSLLGSTPLSIRPAIIETAWLRFTREAFADTTVAGAAFLSASEQLRVPLRRVSKEVSRSGPPSRVPVYRKRWFQWSLVGIGAVLTGAAAVWHREADTTYDEYLASSNAEEIPDLYDRTIDLDRKATTSFLFGQAAMIGGALLLLTGQSD
jgi:PEGA domain